MYGNRLSVPSFSPGCGFQLQMGTAENCFVLCQSNPAWFHFRRFGGNSPPKKKKIARIPQGSAVIPDGEIVRLPTKSLVGTEAMMMTNLRC